MKLHHSTGECSFYLSQGKLEIIKTSLTLINLCILFSHMMNNEEWGYGKLTEFTVKLLHYREICINFFFSEEKAKLLRRVGCQIEDKNTELR